MQAVAGDRAEWLRCSGGALPEQTRLGPAGLRCATRSTGRANSSWGIGKPLVKACPLAPCPWPQLRALLLIAIGAGVIIHNKNLHGKPHFASLHGKVGKGCAL